LVFPANRLILVAVPLARVYLLLVLLLLASVSALLAGDPVGPGTGEAAFPGANGRIAFLRRGVWSTTRRVPDYQLVHLWTVNANGTVPRRLTRRPDLTGSYAPRHAWSPDGTKLVGGSARLRSARGTLLSRHPLWRMNRGFCPSWTPDGGLVFDRAQGLYVVKANGRELRRLPFSTPADQCPRVSADGTQVAFVRFHQDEDGFDHGDFFVAGLDGASLRRLFPGTATDNLEQFQNAPEWSPGGKQIAVLWFRGIEIVDVDSGARRTIEIGSIAAAGSSARRAASVRDLSIAWSPDGRRIAFARKCRIAVINVDGSGLKNVTNPGARACDTLPAWQPIRR
jgi:WD40-like Beta Propeller Repeat